MKFRFFYLIILALLSIIDALLISKPNFLGKLGLWLFKYSYLRTFPRALVTVSIVVGAAFMLSEIVMFIARKKMISKAVGLFISFIFLLASGGILYKVFHDFSKGIYSHTGAYFRYGVFLLPSILILIFTIALIRMIKSKS
jgi:hypothetical protein